MTPETYDSIIYFLHIVAIGLIAMIVFFVIAFVFDAAYYTLYPSPEVIYYFQNCNNLTLFPDGCQVLS